MQARKFLSLYICTKKEKCRIYISFLWYDDMYRQRRRNCGKMNSEKPIMRVRVHIDG